jgi:4-amino-4-deoxy-L-arabinose transferase-like glycosyltransferase
MKIANAGLQYLSIILVYGGIQSVTNTRIAAIVSLVWGSYYIAYQELSSLLTEPLTSFLISVIAYSACKAATENHPTRYNLIGGITLGYLALTKIIFGYVTLGLLIIYLLALLSTKTKAEGKKGILITVIALSINLPYLYYTAKLTGNFPYWGNSGGSSLYWMSTPIEGEFGEWNNADFTANCGHDIKIPCNSSLIEKNHKADFEEMQGLTTLEQDHRLKEIAIRNIKTYPLKYCRNILSNISRMFFGIPNSYFYQREQTAIRIFPNAILFTILVFSLGIFFTNISYFSFEIRFLVFLSLLYLALTSLVSAYPRHLYVLVPCLFTCFSVILTRFVSVKRPVIMKQEPT